MERFSFVFLVAGLGFFALAFLASAWLPMLTVMDLEVRTIEQLASEPPLEFHNLASEYPEAYTAAFGDKTPSEAFAEALRIGHKSYVGEGCWHCHSQQIRPWGNDEARYGRRSFPEEYHNELNMPPLWGTRRIGPDLIRRGGAQSNDWHVAHFWRPVDVTPWSVMPEYPWFYEADGLTPNKRGLSIDLRLRSGYAMARFVADSNYSISVAMGTADVGGDAAELQIMVLLVNADTIMGTSRSLYYPSPTRTISQSSINLQSLN